jgi:hypothetical protein
MENNTLYTLAEINTNSLIIPIDLVIEQDIALDYQCMIKYHLPITPLQCSKCDSLICKSCSQDSRMNNKCPTCQNHLTTKDPSRLIKNTLNSLTLKCLNLNCKSQIKFEKFIEHYLTCEYTPREAKCTGCDLIIKTSNKLAEILEHNRNCNLKEICKFCKKEIASKAMDSHLDNCDEREVSCPNCHEKFSFSNYGEHWFKQCAWSYLNNKHSQNISELNNAIAQKDQKIAELMKIISQKDNVIIDLNTKLKGYEKPKTL